MNSKLFLKKIILLLNTSNSIRRSVKTAVLSHQYGTAVFYGYTSTLDRDEPRLL